MPPARANRQSGGGNRSLVAADEFMGTVRDGIFARQNGIAGEVALDIGGQLFHGGIAALGFTAQSHQEDGVQIARKLAGETRGADGAGGRDGGEGDVAPCSSAFGQGYHSAGTAWFGVTDGIPDLAGHAGFEEERFVAGEQDIEEDTKGIGVGRGGDFLVEELLRACVLGRHHLDAGGGIGGRIGVGIEELGDAEIEEPDRAVFRYQNVAGLDVAVDHEILVSILDGGTDGEKEAEAGAEVELVRVTVFIDGRACDEVHDEKRLAGFSGAAIQEAGDVRVFEVREDVAFGLEAAHGEAIVETAAGHLHGDQLSIEIIDTDGLVDHAHATFSDDLDDAIGADAEACGVFFVGGGRGGNIDKVSGFVIGGEQGADFGQSLGVVITCGGEEGFPLGGGQVERGVEDVFNAPPALGRHALVISL